MVAMDDDNFPTEDDLSGDIKDRARNGQRTMLREPAGFHNICEYLTLEPHRLIFPRGFPFQLRGHVNQPEFVPSPKDATIGRHGRFVVGRAGCGRDDLAQRPSERSPL